jgi:hypothetical protein
MMIVWQRGNAIYYRYRPDSLWLPMQALTTDAFSNRDPFVAPTDSGFDVVWNNNGRILFSEFKNEIWSSPVALTADGDTSNFSPRVEFLNWGHQPFVIWEKTKAPDTARAIMYSFRARNGWSLPDTLASEGDNRHATFARIDIPGMLLVSWVAWRDGNWDIHGISGFPDPDSIHLDGPEQNLSNTPDVDEENFSALSIGIITNAVDAHHPFFFVDAASWKEHSEAGDAIAVCTWSVPNKTLFSLSQTSTSRLPTLSSGIGVSDKIRVWTVWESDSSGEWKLYGTTTDLPLGAVEQEGSPVTARLRYNYPNPFNPTTELSFVVGHSSFVRLEIFDLLGKEVATLVNGVRYPGEYKVHWNAGGLPSGTYIARFEAGKDVQTRKLLLIR